MSENFESQRNAEDIPSSPRFFYDLNDSFQKYYGKDENDLTIQTTGSDFNFNNNYISINDRAFVATPFKEFSDFWINGNKLENMVSNPIFSSHQLKKESTPKKIGQIKEWIKMEKTFDQPNLGFEMTTQPSFSSSSQIFPENRIDHRCLLKPKRRADSKTSTNERDNENNFEIYEEPILFSSENDKDSEWRQVRKFSGVKRGRNLEDEDYTFQEASCYPTPPDFYDEDLRISIQGRDDPSECYPVPEFGNKRKPRIRVAPSRDDENDSGSIMVDAGRQGRLVRFKKELECVNDYNPINEAVPTNEREDGSTVPGSQENWTAYDESHQNPLPFLTDAGSIERQRRPIIIDGCNVAFERTHGQIFESEGIHTCVNYFLQRGFTDITVVVPEHRLSSRGCQNPQLLRELKRQNMLITCWSKKMPNGKWVSSYDDRMIVEIADKRGGVIISNDRFRDLLLERPDWADTIIQRVVGFRFMPGKPDEIMLPADPFGRYGPSLDDVLRF